MTRDGNKTPQLQVFTLQGYSMFPNITTGQECVIDLGAYEEEGIQRGDIVAYATKAFAMNGFVSDENRTWSISRVIGMPGEVVYVDRERVLVNGKEIAEKYDVIPAVYRFGPKLVPDERYFVLGDNRNNSKDSHLWGWLSGDDIRGKVLIGPR